MSVQVAADVAFGHHGGQLTTTCSRDLSPILAQRGRNPRQAEPLVDVFLGLGDQSGQVAGYSLGKTHRGVQRHPARRMLQQFDAVQDVLLRLRAEPTQPAELFRADRVLQLRPM